MPDTSTPALDVEFRVRDYECDMGLVVNNAVYLNYLEHARHELLGSMGIRFGDLAKRGIFLVVTRIEADFKASLTSGDAFIVRTELQRKGRLRLQFNQQIQRSTDGQLMLTALVTGTALNARGRPEMPPELGEILGPSFS
ncbi:MAG: acyl-CoA thioesterase [Acidovorax defluvii]|jgi:acyl-CoA thioester hydrolase